ncbi:unnamed protein product [Clonostachys rosea]|uniref:FAD-binding PCMH-type domain-containing protein n=1 Tax=Bionectria ochroleuca TaxID=29856 RepID=A0ABY6V4B8_BIOOC|nr:unnamed protein product [Clonostachys rosea]
MVQDCDNSEKNGMVLVPQTRGYEASRARYFNPEESGRFPAEIHAVQTLTDVIKALKRAQELGVTVGVRSGGHTPSKPSLVDKGVLIDMSQLNRQVSYDPQSQEVCFGPGVRVYEAWKATDAIGRFFPFGHAPDVGLGGFCLAGGQGFFMRGWGVTITNWIVKLEIVVPDGRVVIASRTQNKDLFWAARGAGQAFFGVVTRIWSRTIPKKKMFGRTLLFEVKEQYEDLLSFAFHCDDKMTKDFTEAAVCTFHDELLQADVAYERVPPSSPLRLLINASAYADDLSEANAMLSSWDQIPENIKGCLMQSTPVSKVDWEDFFKLQEKFNPQGPDRKWGINSILNDIAVPRSEMISAIKPAMCNLPTVSSYGCIYMSDLLNPDEEDAVFSLPQQYYISTFTGWKDPSLQPEIHETMLTSYQKAESVACGMYIADFNQTPSCSHSPSVSGNRIWPYSSFRESNRVFDQLPVWTESARAKFMKIREEWDLQGLFSGYKAFSGPMKGRNK